MHSNLAAFKIFRRSATAAIFSNRGLEFIDIKHLSNDPAKATESLNRFAAWILENFRPELSAYGTNEEDKKLRTAMLIGFVEVLNDLDEEIFNFLRVCQLHHQELVRYLQFCTVSRKWFELFQAQDPKTLSDIQRAARFFYLQKNCYGGLVRRQNFAVSVQDGSNYNPHRIPRVLHLAHERLLGVQLECLPYQEILRKYVRPETFFYLDPPYFICLYYKFNFNEEDYVELAKLLKGIQGRFLLSL